MVARGDMYSQVLKVNNNIGPGIQSLLGTITIDRGTPDNSEDNQVIGNWGPGIMSGTDMVLYGNEGSVADGKSIFIQTHIKVQYNGGWGIITNGNSVYVNEYFNAPVSKTTSIISGNGKRTRACFMINHDGIRSLLRDYDTGGIAAGDDVIANLIEITDNRGLGIDATNDVTIKTGTICNNTEGNISAGDEVNVSSDVTVCETRTD
jgi:hypothetical protein